MNGCVQEPYFNSMDSFILCIESRQLENTMPFLDTFLHFRERTASSRRGAVLGADREKVGKKRNNESPDSAIPSRSGGASVSGSLAPMRNGEEAEPC